MNHQNKAILAVSLKLIPKELHKDLVASWCLEQFQWLARCSIFNFCEENLVDILRFIILVSNLMLYDIQKQGFSDIDGGLNEILAFRELSKNFKGFLSGIEAADD